MFKYKNNLPSELSRRTGVSTQVGINDSIKQVKPIDHKDNLMKIHTKNLTNTLTEWGRLFGLMLATVLIVNAVAISQQLPVNLKTAGNFVILAKTGVSTTGTTAITGNIGISPAAATFITGFSLIADATNVFATSSAVTGKIYASNYAVPSPANLTTAIGDMQTAYTDAAGRTPIPTGTFLNVGAGEMGGQTLVPGLYKWTTNVTISTNVTLSGGANDVWIFQISGNLTESNGMKVMIGSAQAKNIFWQVAGKVTIGTTADFKGDILCQTLIALNTGATLEGKALAQTAITLEANAVTDPGVVTAVKEHVSAPADFSLSQNYPNPFNPTTQINYSVPQNGFMTLNVYNVLGEKVAALFAGQQTAGTHIATFDGSKFASGLYFYRLNDGSFVSIKKMILMK